VTYRQNWGEDRVYFHDSEGRLRSLSTGWTNLGADDPYVAISGGRSAFRTADLLELVGLLEELREAHRNA